MKNKNKKSMIAQSGLLAIGLVAIASAVALAASNSTLSQAITAGTLAIDIVDSGGTTVASPAVTFAGATYSYATQQTTGTLGTSSERIRVYNPTATAAWTASIAGSATTAVWDATGATDYDFNDASGSGYTDGADTDSFGGQLAVAPAGATLAGVSGCSTSNISLGSNSAFVEGTTDSISIASSTTGATFCRWDITGVGLTQNLPAGQATGNYSLNLVLSIL